MNLFKYIVFAFFAFNIFHHASAEVIFDGLPDDEIEVESLPFFNAGALPPPAQLRQIIDSSENSPIGRMLIIGKYFDAKYQGDALDKDITSEVALIFPEYSPSEVANVARNIKMAINAYRFGLNKWTETKEKIVAPEDPPLIVSDDEYAVMGDREYLPVDDGKYAVISDFKKVVTYGTDPREIKSWQAKLKRDADKHRKKTDFEKFQEMYEKIEFSKLTAYGVTLPNPFVGNAGVGVWVEDEDGYRARLISELARTGETKEVLVALHVAVPNHRLMLALARDDEQKAPKITLQNMQNVASYEVFYPMPWQTSGTNITGVYAGDFAFIIKLQLEDPQKKTYFDAEFNFSDCDFELTCAPKTMTLALEIQNDETGDDVKSSMLQFIRQSYYNIPKADNEFIHLQKASYDAATHRLNFEFSYDTSVKNWAFLLDNSHHSTFGTPRIIIAKDKIFVQVDVESGFEGFEQLPLTLYVRLNSFAFIKQTIDLKTPWTAQKTSLPFKMFIHAFLFGILFCLMPFGFYTLAGAMFDAGYSWKRKLIRAISKAVVLVLFAGFVLNALNQNPDLFYINLKHHLFYLGIVFTCLVFCFWRQDFPKAEHIVFDMASGIMRGLWCILMLALVVTPFQPSLMLDVMQSSDLTKAYIGFGLMCGLLMFDILAFCRKKAFGLKGGQVLDVCTKMMLSLSVATVAFYIFIQLGLIGSVKAVLWGLLAFAVLKYLFNFLSALYHTDFNLTQKRWSAGVTILLIMLMVDVFAHKLQTLAPKMPQPVVALEKIKSAVDDGKNVFVIVRDRTCLVCLYNRLTALHQFNIKRLMKQYPSEFIVIDATNTTPQMIAYFKELKHIQAPLYVFYNSWVPNGIVLPDILNETEVVRTFERFAL